MADIVMTKTPMGTLAPVDQAAADYVAKLKMGAGVTVTVKRNRNLQFHRKLFALLNIAFDAWEPGIKEHRGMPVQKNFERFRKDVTIAAGFYEVVANIKGEVRAEAKSISFDRMDEAEFAELYSAIINVVLQRILTHYTRADLDRVVDEVLRFT